MTRMPKFTKGELVKFTKKALVFDKSNYTEFYVKKGTLVEVAEDHDIGPISACTVKLKESDGKVIIGETDSRHLAKVKSP